MMNNRKNIYIILDGRNNYYEKEIDSEVCIKVLQNRSYKLYKYRVLDKKRGRNTLITYDEVEINDEIDNENEDESEEFSQEIW